MSGIDAAADVIEFARRRLPEADLRVGPIEQPPWPDDSFDVVSGFNAFQLAADFVAALVEARRVARTGGRVAICNLRQSQRVRSDLCATGSCDEGGRSVIKRTDAFFLVRNDPRRGIAAVQGWKCRPRRASS